MIRTSFGMALLAWAVSSGSTAAVAQKASGSPVELGAVPWHRHFEKAKELSRDKDKPLMLLFQEVPG